MKLTKETYFKRQITLSEIGSKGQDLLQKSKVLIIGCGGLGSPAAVYIAASGVGEIHLVDFDIISATNLHRQVFFNTADIGHFKAEVLAREIKQKAPFTKISFSNIAVEKNNIMALVSSYDLVVDGTDNLSIKYLINDACAISKKPLVYGSLYKFDGYVSIFNVLDHEGNLSCNLRDAFPEIASDIPNCETAGTLNPIVGIMALLQTNEVIKFLSKTGKLLTDKLLIYNSLENSQLQIKLQKNANLNIEEIFKNTDYRDPNCEIQDPSFLISADELKKRISYEDVEIISILNDPSTPLPFDVQQKIPYNIFTVEQFSPSFNKNYVIVCHRGITSYDVTLKIKEKYPTLSVLSLSEGIDNYL